ncbi:hypothetical protein M9458_032868 [Cirrhinus mrigala]|uniref:Retrotransposon gag domain-containing protein n=1 Tax=Cirrhinus mrigala TaxID=683832 RepID=A0ABD0PFI7_CIRMR
MFHTSSSYSSFPVHHDITEEPTTSKMFWAEDFIMNIQQAERPLEQYVEEFLSVVHLVSWSDAMINACFQMGLNNDKLFCSITPDDCHKPVAEFINYVLSLCHSNYYVDVKDSNLSPIWEHTAAPAHYQLGSSTCCSNELTPVLQSSSSAQNLRPAHRLRLPELPPRHPPVSTPPMSGLPVLSWAGNALSSPKKILGRGLPPDPPWPPELYTRPWLPEPPTLLGHMDCILGHGSPSSRIHHGHLNCVLGHGSPNSLTRHGHLGRGSLSSLILLGHIDCVLVRGSLSSLIRPGGVPPIPPVSTLHKPPGG